MRTSTSSHTHPTARAAIAAALLLLGTLSAGAQMPRGRGQVRGAISGPDGEPLIGISVVLQPVSRTDMVYATSTDDKGRYAFNGLVADHYRIRADGQGYITELKEGVRVQPPFRAIIDFGMVPTEATLEAEGAADAPAEGIMHSLEGILVSAEGEPVMEGSVMLEKLGEAGNVFYARTDADGRFKFSELPAGRYDVTTKSPGLIPLHLINRSLPAGDTLYVRLVAPSYPLEFKGWLDDLLPPEEALPPPDPRLVELGPHGVAPLVPDAPAVDPDAGDGDDPTADDPAPERGDAAQDDTTEAASPDADTEPTADATPGTAAEPATSQDAAPAPATSPGPDDAAEGGEDAAGTDDPPAGEEDDEDPPPDPPPSS